MGDLHDFIRTTPPPRHLKGTESAHAVSTEAFDLAQIVASDAVADRTAAVFDGPAGTGKRFAAVTAASSSGLPVVWVEPPVAPRVRALQIAFARALGLTYAPNAPTDELDRLLITALPGTGRVVVVDEVARLGRDGLEELRFLHCQPSAAWSLFLVGAGLDDILARNKALATRIPDRVHFRPLARKESIAFACDYHPHFASASAELLDRLEQVVKGNLRLWAQVLRHALRENPDRLTADSVAIALVRLRGMGR